MALGNQIRKYRELKGWTLEELEYRSGVQTGTISALERRDSKRSIYTAQIAKAFGLTQEELMDENAVTLKQDTLSSESNDTASPYIVNNLKSGYTRFGLLDVEAAAGTGIVNSEWPEIVQQIDVSTEWASRTFGKNFSKIRVITARGDSMKGTVEDGDVLFVDSTVREYQRDGIYILAVGNNLKVKRLQQRTDGSFAVISDNKNYDTEIIDRETGESLTICGLVVATIALKKLL